MSNHNAPHEPKWPSRTLDELLEVVFRDATIHAFDHPASLRLIGRS
jgi:hypothetical protein